MYFYNCIKMQVFLDMPLDQWSGGEMGGCKKHRFRIVFLCQRLCQEKEMHLLTSQGPYSRTSYDIS